MNLKNLIMWVVIVLLSVGLFNMFQDPNNIQSTKNSLPFSHIIVTDPEYSKLPRAFPTSE